MKEEISNKINELYRKICDVSYSEHSPHLLKSYVRQILEQISILKEIDKSENYDHISFSLNHTLNKEVNYVELAYEKTLKKNAAKIRHKEYHQELERAIKQIEIDIFSLLIENKIE